MPVADLDECQWPTEWPGNRDASPYVCPDCYSEEAMTEAAIVCTCPFCNRFFRNCKHNKTRRTQPCHFYQLIFTDGACSSNGLTGATSGIGVAIGNEQSHQWSIPVDDSVDPAAPRTSQRAELLAGIEGIRRMMAMDNDPHMKVATMRHQKDVWIIASDSEYLIKGMVEWMPSWKENNWRTSNGTRPKNLDLFLALEAIVVEAERECNTSIGFWWIPREKNTIADRLAKFAAKPAQY